MQFIIDVVLTTFFYYLIAFSFSVIYETSRYFHFAHAAIIAIPVYLTLYFSRAVNFSPLLAIIISILVSVLIALFIKVVIYQRFTSNNNSNWQILVISIGCYTILVNLISIFFGNRTITLTENIDVGYRIYGAYITETQLFILLISLLLIIISYLISSKTPVGKKIELVSSNYTLSKVFGINSEKIINWSFVIGSSYAAITGIMLGFELNINPNIGFNWLLYGAIAMMLGGRGSLKYLLMGALFLAIIQSTTAILLGSKWMVTSAYLSLIIFLTYKPFGFSSQIIEKVEI